MSRWIWAALLGLAAVAALAAFARRPLPDPVEVAIANIAQETEVWCWAAVVQQLLQAAGRPLPRQCEVAAEGLGRPHTACCGDPSTCAEPGSLALMESLLHRYGAGRAEGRLLRDGQDLYRVLAGGEIVAMALFDTGVNGHVVLVRGLTWQSTWFGLGRKAVLAVNDPAGVFPAALPLSELKPYWRGSLVFRPAS